ncbi:MAG: ATP-binding protein [Nitrospinae bacterium]|nr:ATP-binding protein [Nitrospinota bacterium]
MKTSESLQTKLVRTFVAVWVAGILLITLLLTGLFYLRDRRLIITQTREKANMIRTELLASMSTAGPEAAEAAVTRFKQQSNFGFRMVEGREILKQFGTHDGEFPRDRMEDDVLSGKISEYSDLTGTKFRYVIPFVTDERCGKCHQDLDGKPMPAGRVNGLAEFVYDVTEWRNSSLRLLAEMELFVVLVMLVAGYSLFIALRRQVLLPLREITGAIVSLGEGGAVNAEAIKADNAEISVLAEEVRKMAESIEAKRKAHILEMENERKKTEQIKNFVLSQADHHGITSQKDISLMTKRLARAVGDVETDKMAELISEFVTLEKKEITIGNDISLIRPVSLYLTDLIAGKKGNVKKGSIELVLEEAVTNAIIHGNLELDSNLKDEDFERFEKEMEARKNLEPYKGRKVHISYDFKGNSAIFKITDEGAGFDWKSHLSMDTKPDLAVHGRGIIIIRAFASSVTYDEKGNQIIITFDV